MFARGSRCRRSASSEPNRVLLQFGFVCFVTLDLTGCLKKGGEAIVLEKEHIDVAEPLSSVTPEPSASATDEPTRNLPPNREYAERELAADETLVDDVYVMKKDVRGTKKNPRASKEEQWRVKVRMVDGGRVLYIRADRSQYDKVKAGDRVKVRYSQGKYTGTVWNAEMVD
jgi:hypothetical protein